MHNTQGINQSGYTQKGKVKQSKAKQSKKEKKRTEHDGGEESLGCTETWKRNHTEELHTFEKINISNKDHESIRSISRKEGKFKKYA